MELVINTKPAVEKYVIAVAGEVDISNADKLRTAVDMALEQPCEAIALDLSEVPYIDSTGIGVLVGAAHRVVQLLGVDQEISISGE